MCLVVHVKALLHLIEWMVKKPHIQNNFIEVLRRLVDWSIKVLLSFRNHLLTPTVCWVALIGSQAEGNQNVSFISDKCSLEILALDQAMMVW